MRRAAVLLAVALAACGALSKSNAEPAAEALRSVDNLVELKRALTSCWRAPPGSEGFEITMRLALSRTGALRGPPRVTYKKLLGPPERQAAFVEAAAQALIACTPVPLSEAFGRIISQQVLTLRLQGGGRAVGI